MHTKNSPVYLRIFTLFLLTKPVVAKTSNDLIHSNIMEIEEYSEAEELLLLEKALDEKDDDKIDSSLNSIIIFNSSGNIIEAFKLLLQKKEVSKIISYSKKLKKEIIINLPSDLKSLVKLGLISHFKLKYPNDTQNYSTLLASKEDFYRALISNLKSTHEISRDIIVLLLKIDNHHVTDQSFSFLLNKLDPKLFQINIKSLLDNGLLGDGIEQFLNPDKKNLLDEEVNSRIFTFSNGHISFSAHEERFSPDLAIEEDTRDEDIKSVESLSQLVLYDPDHESLLSLDAILSSLNQSIEDEYQQIISTALENEAAYDQALMNAVAEKDPFLLQKLFWVDGNFFTVDKALALCEYACQNSSIPLIEFFAQILPEYDNIHTLSLKSKSALLAVYEAKKTAENLASEYLFQLHQSEESQDKDYDDLVFEFTESLKAFIKCEKNPPYSRQDLKVLENHLKEKIAKSPTRKVTGIFLYETSQAWAEHLRKYNIIPSMKTSL